MIKPRVSTKHSIFLTFLLCNLSILPSASASKPQTFQSIDEANAKAEGQKAKPSRPRRATPMPQEPVPTSSSPIFTTIEATDIAQAPEITDRTAANIGDDYPFATFPPQYAHAPADGGKGWFEIGYTGTVTRSINGGSFGWGIADPHSKVAENTGHAIVEVTGEIFKQAILTEQETKALLTRNRNKFADIYQRASLVSQAATIDGKSGLIVSSKAEAGEDALKKGQREAEAAIKIFAEEMYAQIIATHKLREMLSPALSSEFKTAHPISPLRTMEELFPAAKKSE